MEKIQMDSSLFMRVRDKLNKQYKMLHIQQILAIRTYNQIVDIINEIEAEDNDLERILNEEPKPISNINDLVEYPPEN